jgi:hypothetical protein
LRPLFACGPYPSARDPASSHAALPTCAVNTRSPPPGPCPCAHLAAVADGLHLCGGVKRALRARSGGAMVPAGRPRGRASAAPFPPPRGHGGRRGRPEAASHGGRFPARSASCAWAFRRSAASMAGGASSASGRGELPPWLVWSRGA